MDLVLYLFLFLLLLASVIFLPKRAATRRFGLMLLSAALLLEIFVCNFHSFHLVLGNYQAVTYTAESSELTLSGGVSNPTLELRGLSFPVGTLRLECEMEENLEEDFVGTPFVNVRVDAKDETQQGYYRSAVTEGQLIRGDERSAYLVLNLSGNVSDLRIRLTPKTDGAVRFRSVTLNESIPMVFSPLRLLLLVGAAFGIYALITCPSMKDTYENRRARFRALALLITLALILGAAAITFLYQYDRTGGISGGFQGLSRAVFGRPAVFDC